MKYSRDMGITLISLVITIVVILILAGVTLSIILGGGILYQTKRATYETKATQEYEQAQLILATAQTLKYTSNISFADSINGALENEFTFDSNTNTLISPSGEEYTVNSDYTIMPNIKEPGEIAIVTSKYTDSNGKIAIIPAGFYISIENSEQIIDNGLVIIDSADNEFVWIPVKNIADMCIPNGVSEGNYAGQLYSFSSGIATKKAGFTEGVGEREPDAVRDAGVNNRFDNLDTNYTNAGIPRITNADEFKELLQKEFNEMAESVKMYKGFYIGRYETSYENNVAQSKHDRIPMRSVNWYTMYQRQKGVSEESVRSTMIWGSAWDQTMTWLKGIENTNVAGTHYITNATGMGNYSDVEIRDSNGVVIKDSGTNTILNTGVVAQTMVKNIYDLGGNVQEWTIEAISTSNRSTRGR